LLAWVLPPIALILGNGKRRPKKSKGRNGSGGTGKAITGAGIALVIIFLFSLRGEAQDNTPAKPQAGTADSGAETLYENALAAQDAENWERAIELFSAGSKTYTSDFRFPWALGNLYYYRRLYRLAWDEYRQAEKIATWEMQDETALLYLQLANTAGYLNWNDISANYLEKVLVFEPDNPEAIGDLAWMYFKLHRLEDGERLLLRAMKNNDQDSDFSMTLGTIYSDMFRYDDAKNCYLNSIRGGEMSGNRLIAALAHYNLSILESRFYQFSLAYEQTNASLEEMNRASGRLARGELYMRRMELPLALGEYQDAYGMDSSPLSKLNLAQAFQIGGRLTEAALYANDCLKAGDHSWMLNYGIDPVRYIRDIHEVLKDTYEGLYKAEILGFGEKWSSLSAREIIQSCFRMISYKFQSMVNRNLFYKYSLLAADAYGKVIHTSSSGEIHLDALTQYYNAFEAYPRRALTYLRQARDIEEPLIPLSAPSYEYEEGRLLSDRKLLSSLTGEFDPIWERDMIAKVFTELASIGKKTEKQDAAERLFALNRGALLQNGIRLPVDLRINGASNQTERALKNAAWAAGLEPSRLDSARYTLTLKAENTNKEGIISCELYDGGRGITLYSRDLPLPSLDGSHREAFTRALREGIFNAFTN
ncbi:MAG: hypothetical protein FWF26_04110, partial [Treponema sp.]|nr:hypothetical protein [Treponema sp.]